MPSIKLRKYGNSVYVIYSHEHKIFKIFTGVKVEDQYWNLCALRKNCPDYANLDRQITHMLQRVIDASFTVKNLPINPTVDRVRIEFHNQMKEPELVGKSFFEQYEEFIKTKCYKPSTHKKTLVFKHTLENFCTLTGYKMNIDTWDQLKFGQFVQHLLIHLKMADSTIHRLVKGLKTFLMFVYPTKDLKWMKYKVLPTETKIVALKKPELKFLIDQDLGGYLEKTRDLFVFLATTGMRFSDSQLFDPKWVTEEKILEFRQLKTGHKAYPPLYEVSRRVLLKYDGIPPQISNQKFNEHLKELFVELKMDRAVTTYISKNNTVYESIEPLSAMVSSQLARSTFAVLCLESGMLLQNVMQMMGHNDYKSMKPYLNYMENTSTINH